MLPRYLVGGAESGGQDSGLLVTEGRRGNLSLHIGGPANLETYLDLINIPSSKRDLLKSRGDDYWDNGSIYRRGILMIYGHVKMNLGVNGPMVLWVFTSRGLNCQSSMFTAAPGLAQ